MLLTTLLILAAAPAPIETRCGWLQNPTPGNWWLVDRTGEWTLQTQGSDGVPGWDTLPMTEPAPRQWVRTNGSYGYGCACARLRVDRRDRTIVRIERLTNRPLAVCRADRRLPKP